jgi:Ca2+-binding EF-hand superfamily protein
MAHRTTLMLGALLLTGANTMPGQYNEIHPDDSDRDGTLTRREWRGEMVEFRRLDSNRDGVLSGTEVPGARTMRNRRSERGRDEATDRLDKNQSGVVEGYEWPYNAAVFHRLDTDQDSVLSPNELTNITSVTVRELDKNGDGRLDDTEWPGGYADFNRLDRNRDGKVGSNEYFQSGGEFQKRQRFDNWDANRNGIIESTEWKAAPKLFYRLDTDRDSRVSWEEFIADREPYRPPYDWR